MTNEQSYLVPERLTDEQETNMRSELLGGPILGPADMFARMVGIVGTPIQPCADVETFIRIAMIGKTVVGLMYPNEDRQLPAQCEVIPLVRRTDMEAQVAVRDAEIVRLRGLFEKMADILTTGHVDMRSLMACRKYVAAGLEEVRDTEFPA